MKKKKKKMTNPPRMFTIKMRIRLYRHIIWCLSLSGQACYTHFDTRIIDYKTSQLLSLIIFGRPTNLPSGDKWELTQIFELINCR